MYKVSHAPSSTHTRLLLPVSLYTHQAHNIRASPPPPPASPHLLLPPSKPLPCPTPSSAPRTTTSSPRASTHGENSPSLCPTIWSEITTSWYTLPLCTWNISPTMLGRMVAERACVRIGVTFWPGRTLKIGRLGRVLDRRGPGGLREGGVTGRCAGLDWGGVSLGD